MTQAETRRAPDSKGITSMKPVTPNLKYAAKADALFDDLQIIRWRKRTVRLGLRADAIIEIIEFKTVSDTVRRWRHRHETFPSVLHDRHGPQRVKLAIDEDIRLDAVPTQ